MKDVKIIRSALKHVRSRESIIEALETAGEPVHTEPGLRPGETAHTYIGTDAEGLELHIVAIDQPRWLLVIHAQPNAWNRSDK